MEHGPTITSLGRPRHASLGRGARAEGWTPADDPRNNGLCSFASAWGSPRSVRLPWRVAASGIEQANRYHRSPFVLLKAVSQAARFYAMGAVAQKVIRDLRAETPAFR